MKFKSKLSLVNKNRQRNRKDFERQKKKKKPKEALEPRLFCPGFGAELIFLSPPALPERSDAALACIFDFLLFWLFFLFL